MHVLSISDEKAFLAWQHAKGRVDEPKEQEGPKESKNDAAKGREKAGVWPAEEAETMVKHALSPSLEPSGKKGRMVREDSLLSGG